MKTFVTHLNRYKRPPIVCIIDHKLEGDSTFFVAKCGLVGVYTAGDGLRNSAPTCVGCLAKIEKK